MASQLNEVFTAKPKSIYEIFLFKGTLCFYKRVWDYMEVWL
jgi:hypothetical protein